ncbi:MAG: hypothetical protein E4G99_03460 [Anaerolineales bacterium]|nr:MAG: hypothetical protein E4G99_03460 [Anaerolineales bacterium]
MEPRCSDIQPLLAGFGLEALDARDRRAVDAHLELCAQCQAELEEYQYVALGLLMSAPTVKPPARLRAQLINEISSAEVSKRTPKRFFAFRFQSMTGALAFGLLLIFNVTFLIQFRQINAQQADLITTMEEDRTVLGLSSYPEANRVALEGSDAYGTLIFEPELNVAVLYAWGLVGLDQNQIYQVWLIEPGGGRVSGGIFHMESDESFARLLIHSPESMGTYVGLGVTIEPAGGSPGPSGSKVLGVEL